MSLGQSIRSGVKWLAMGNVARRLLEFAYGVILARLLVPADFGMIVTVQVFTGVVGLFASGGMGQALIRAKQADERDFTAIFTFQMGLGLLIYLSFYIAAPFLADFLENPLYKDLIRVSSISFLLRPFTQIRNAWLSREMRFKTLTYMRLGAGVMTGVFSVAMAWFGLGVWSLTLSGLFSTFITNVVMSRFTPLRLRFNLDLAIIRKHGAFGMKITASSFITYLRNEAKHLIISKMAGPAFLGLFNKAESMARIPNQMIMPATMEPLFRGLSKIQDNLDQTKYMYYRSITLLMAYTAPLYVLLWWVAQPFIYVVYGEKWQDAGSPMSILALGGFFLNLIYPSSAVLSAQNRLGKEMIAQLLNLGFIIIACYLGLGWGLEGVAWGIILGHALMAVHMYWLVLQTLPTRVTDLFRAVLPGLGLALLVFSVLALTHFLLAPHLPNPFLYLAVMSGIGGLTHSLAFLFLPIPALSTEAGRWRSKLRSSLAFLPRVRRVP